MHGWPHKEAVNILHALVPALKPNARVLISGYILPDNMDRAENLINAKLIREIDLQMMAVFNSRERTKDEFVALFAAADPRLRFSSTHQVPEDPKSCIFEAVWEP
ncbi:hypothetical protein RRF57_013396 [Xylaria bambusicola]|uniref:O-methyltransferase C-terminal domain-containing protein n=1 Tax=Xylaria bambusicola TaxID=326684 RepID=A0AAN7V2T0_9PEZI